MSEQAQAAVQDNTATTAQGDGQSQASLLTGEVKTESQSSEAKQPEVAEKPQGESESTEDNGATNDDKSTDETKDESADAAPEKYELKAPEGFEKLDPVLLESFEPLARELNLSNDKANKIIETMMPKVVERITEQHQAAWAKQLETWVGDVKADKEIGGDVHPEVLTVANRALSQFASPELLAVLAMPSKDNPKGLGIGNHPELVRVFYRIGKASSEDSIVNSNSNSIGDGKSAADIMFGNPDKGN